MKIKTINSSIALKLNTPIIFLGFVLIGIIYSAYLIQAKNIKQYHLQNLAENISEQIILSAEINVSLSQLRQITSSLADKNHIKRILVVDDKAGTIITDNHDAYIGKKVLQTLSSQEELIYRKLNNQAKQLSSEFFQESYYHLQKPQTEESTNRPYQIFIILNEADTLITAPNLLSKITVIFSIGMLLIFVALYLVQRRLLLSPLAKITQHLTTQNKKDLVSIIPYEGKDEIGRLVQRYNKLIETKLQHDKELEATRKHIDGIANTAPVLLSYIGTDLCFKFVNQLHEDWFGIPIEVFVGNTLEDILGEQSFKVMKPEIEKVLSGKKTSFQSTIPYQYLEDKCVQINFVPNNVGKSIDGFFVCIEDLSITRKNETKLAEYAQKLEYREFALEEEKLVAEQALKIKSEFLASMSHEIRTPMNGVLGMLSLLMDTNLNEDQHTKASLAKTSAESLLTLINDILDFSKVESGKLDIENIDFNLLETIENTTEGLSKLAEDKSISLIIDTADMSEIMVKGDPGRLRQILNNLLSNAIKFTRQGSVIVTVSLREDFSGALSLVCEVKDTGIGIAPNKLDAIFDSFTQEDASTTRQYGGTGLGLTIAKKLCQLMGGDIQASSEVGKGSTFTCSMLLEPSTLKPSSDSSIDLANRQVFIIDSDPDCLTMCSKQLSKWGAIVLSASNKKHGLKLLKEHFEQNQQNNYPIVLVSLELPNKGALEFVDEVKQSLDISKIRFILMAPLAFKYEQGLLEKHGFHDYFYKPITRSKLSRTLKKGQTKLTTSTPIENKLQEIIIPTNKRILLVEDTPINQLVVKGILGAFNLSCDVAANGIEALDMIKNMENLSPYDVILMDCQMPEMDGYEATEAIRNGDAGEKAISIPIIAMTANAMKGDEEECLEAGMDDYMSKPVSADIIKAKLAKWLL